MFGLTFRYALSRAVTLAVMLSPCISYAAQPQDRVGVLMEFKWNVGSVRPDQSRWQSNFALGSTGNIVRSMYETAFINGSIDDSFEYEYFAGFDQERSLLPLQWSTDSLGNSLGMLYGVPVVTKFSPVFNASGSSTGSGSSILSNPWVWVGAVAVGVAATSGGGGSGSAGGSGSGGTNVTVVGDGGAVDFDEGCSVVSGEDATSVEPLSGC